MRETRLSGSEGGGVAYPTLPTPINPQVPVSQAAGNFHFYVAHPGPMRGLKKGS